MESLIDLQRLTGEYLWDLGVNIILALVILVVGRLAANAISGLTRRLLQRSGLEEILVNFSATITNALLTLVVIIAAVDRLGVNTTSLIALLGAAGIAVGLALKDSLGNFAAGIMLIVSRPFRTGDYVEVAGSAGSVEKISLFTTTLLTPDNREITVPNGAIYADTITNWSARDTRRIDLVIGISYEDNLATAKHVIKSVLARRRTNTGRQSVTGGRTRIGRQQREFDSSCLDESRRLLRHQTRVDGKYQTRLRRSRYHNSLSASPGTYHE